MFIMQKPRFLLIFLVFLVLVVSGCVGQNQNQTIESIKHFEKRSDGAFRITNCYPKSCQNPVFSPDSTKVMFTKFLNGYNKGPSELVIINLKTGEEKLIVSSDGKDNVNVPYGSWIDDNIVFSSDRLGNDTIFIINSDGSNVQPVTSAEDVYKIEPVFNPVDINWIVFEYVNSAHHYIKLLDRKNQREFFLTNNSNYDDRLPSWSSDGKKILWQRTDIGKDDWKIQGSLYCMWHRRRSYRSL